MLEGVMYAVEVAVLDSGGSNYVAALVVEDEGNAVRVVDQGGADSCGHCNQDIRKHGMGLQVSVEVVVEDTANVDTVVECCHTA